MIFEETAIAGCFVLRPRRLADERGRFVKTFQADWFVERGLRTDWREEYYSSSLRGVLRGMHFQTPPADHAKLVYCLSGAVLDVVVDLRAGSPSQGAVVAFTLDAEAGLGVYAPTGCAHGFLAISEQVLMLYKVTSLHSPEHDQGVRWDTIGFPWPVARPLLSPRDRAHPPLDLAASPFVFDPEDPAR